MTLAPDQIQGISAPAGFAGDPPPMDPVVEALEAAMLAQMGMVDTD
jgi:hypothetical protein